MGSFLGVIWHAIGGSAAASFYIPFKKVKAWAWESYWLVSGVAAWIIAPWVVGTLTVPDLLYVIQQASEDSKRWSYILGVLWGVGGLTFGLSMRYLGMSLGYALALGCSAAFGTLIPPIVEGRLGALLGTSSGLILLAGVSICLIGIGICGWAGIQKENELPEAQKKAVIKEFNLRKGVGVALISGLLSACMAFALAAGKPIADQAVAAGANPLWQNNAVLVVVLLGGFTTNFLWCIILNFRKRSFPNYFRAEAASLGSNYLFSSMAGIVWYFQFFFYGMGSSRMGAFDFASWTLHMAFIILFSNLWGLYFKEWQGASSRTRGLIISGLAVILIATLVIGLGTYLSFE